MMGRAAYDTPFLLAAVDRQLFGCDDDAPERDTTAEAYLAYAARMIGHGERPHHVLRHAVALFHGCTGARRWRQALTAAGHRHGDLQELLSLVSEMGQRRPLAA